MTWMLDTNTWIKYLKPGNETLVDRLSLCQEGDIVLSSVVKSELWHGAQKYEKVETRLQRLDAIFNRHLSLAYDDAAAWQYALIRHHLELSGNVIGPNDLKIAAICLVHQLTLVTSNIAEFSRVPGLKVESWG